MRTWFLDRLPPLRRETPFRRYWTGYSLSQVGSQVSGLALPLTAVLVLHANPEAMGLLSAAGLIPSLLFSIHAGAWVDRRGQRRQLMIVADIARALLLACIPAAYFLGWLSVPGLLVIGFLVGTLSVLFRVSASTLFVSLVPKARYVEANSLLQGGLAIAWLTGPSIGGFLVQLLSAPVAMRWASSTPASIRWVLCWEAFCRSWSAYMRPCGSLPSVPASDACGSCHLPSSGCAVWTPSFNSTY